MWSLNEIFSRSLLLYFSIQNRTRWSDLWFLFLRPSSIIPRYFPEHAKFYLNISKIMRSLWKQKLTFPRNIVDNISRITIVFKKYIRCEVWKPLETKKKIYSKFSKMQTPLFIPQDLSLISRPSYTERRFSKIQIRPQEENFGAGEKLWISECIQQNYYSNQR